MQQLKTFLQKKGVNPSFKLYFIDAMGAMAQGLFASLLLGTILNTLAQQIPALSKLSEVAAFAQNGYVVGAAIGVSVAFALKAQGLVLYGAAVVGAIGYMMGDSFLLATGAEMSCTAGPAGAFVAVVVAVEIGKMFFRTTKVDIIVTPLVVTLVGFATASLVCPAIARGMYHLGNFINTATELEPLLMGVLVSVIVGIILTLPISSAAICSMIGIAGIAGGAATAGCCAQMVGFAVMSYRVNGMGGLIAQGLGTSMLQMGNIVRRPQIWIPSIITSAITGPLATMVFRMTTNGVAAGMGTCGLVGPLGVLAAAESVTATTWIGILLICFILPAGLTLLFSEIMIRLGLYQPEDMKLNL